MSKSEAIAKRLKEFGQIKFGADHGWKKQFADALGVTTQHLDRYLSAASQPGNKMYTRLIHLGCDIQWLLTGIPSKDLESITMEEKEILIALKKSGVDSLAKVRYLLNPEDLAGDIAAAAVKEIKSRWPRKRSTSKKS
ncbi:MAG: hypothetical protein WEB62_01700 [Bacteroidota bacterium]